MISKYYAYFNAKILNFIILYRMDGLKKPIADDLIGLKLERLIAGNLITLDIARQIAIKDGKIDLLIKIKEAEKKLEKTNKLSFLYKAKNYLNKKTKTL